MFLFGTIIFLASMALGSNAQESNVLKTTYDWSQPVILTNLSLAQYHSLFKEYIGYRQSSVINTEYFKNELDDVCMLIGANWRFSHGYCVSEEIRRFFCHDESNGSSRGFFKRCGEESKCEQDRIINAAGTSVIYPFCTVKVRVDTLVPPPPPRPGSSKQAPPTYTADVDLDAIRQMGNMNWDSFMALAEGSEHLGFTYTYGKNVVQKYGANIACYNCHMDKGAKLSLMHNGFPTSAFFFNDVAYGY